MDSYDISGVLQEAVVAIRLLNNYLSVLIFVLLEKPEGFEGVFMFIEMFPGLRK